jgi:hypothetical protein
MNIGNSMLGSISAEFGLPVCYQGGIPGPGCKKGTEPPTGRGSSIRDWGTRCDHSLGRCRKPWRLQQICSGHCWSLRPMQVSDYHKTWSTYVQFYHKHYVGIQLTSSNLCVSVDHLVCNAGIASVGAFQEIPDVTNYSSQLVNDMIPFP